MKQAVTHESMTGFEDRPLRLNDVEAGYIRSLIERFHGNRRKVAAYLGVSERTIYRKIKRYGLR